MKRYRFNGLDDAWIFEAENEEEAMEKYEKNNLPIFEIKYELVRRKENVASVYDKGTINLRMKKKV